jgi:hypothetical protein
LLAGGKHWRKVATIVMKHPVPIAQRRPA